MILSANYGVFYHNFIKFHRIFDYFSSDKGWTCISLIETSWGKFG